MLSSSGPRILGRGYVERVFALDGDTVVCGWWHPVEAAVLAGFRVTLGGAGCEVLGYRSGMDSLDVAKDVPWCAVAERARFAIRIRVPRSSIAPHSCLAVEPLVLGRRAALGIYTIVDPVVERPSSQDIDSIGGGYELMAFEFLAYMADLCSLPRSGSVLDVGCGIGRMAYPLSSYLNAAGSYCGVDVMQGAIASAQGTLGVMSPRVRFGHVDVRNSMYNPLGSLETAEVRLGAFVQRADLVLMASVATHMTYDESAHYLRESRAVLAPGGRMLVSAFLMDAETEMLAGMGRAARRFAFDVTTGCYIDDATNPMGAVAIPVDRMQAMAAEAGFELEHVHPGRWSGRTPWLSYQDICVLKPA